MAVVFISPKQRQKMFFLGITAAFLLVIIIISLMVFLSEPKEVAPALVFNKPKVNINMDVFGEEQFKSLVPFSEMHTQYSYKAASEDGEEQAGFISAVSLEEARSMLEDIGLRVIELEEADIGRENPFTPYYEPIMTPPPIAQGSRAR